MHTERQKDRQVHGQTDRQIDNQTDRDTGRQTDMQTYQINTRTILNSLICSLITWIKQLSQIAKFEVI